MSRKVYLLAFTAISVLIGLVSYSGDAYAAPGEASNILDNQIVSYVSAQCEADPLGTCPGSYHSKLSISYLYVPTTTGSASVTIDGMDITNPVPNNRNGLSSFSVSNLLTNGDCSGLKDVRLNNAITNGTILSFTNSSSSNHRTISNPSTAVSYNVYCVLVETSASRSYPARENVRHRLHTGSGNYLGTFAGTSTSIGTGYFGGNSQLAPSPYPYSKSRPDPNWWGQVVAFSAPCDVSGPVSGSIVMYDLDTYANINKSQEVYVVKTLKPGVTRPVGTSDGLVGLVSSGSPGITEVFSGPNGTRVYDINDGPTGSTWTINPSGELWRSEYTYSVYLRNIGAGNKVRIRLPYDQINSVLTCASPKASTCNYRAYSIGVLNPNSGQYEYNSYTELADDAQFNARQGQRVRVRMRTVNEGTNVWTRGGTSGYGLAQNAAYPTEGTYNEIPGPTYLDWQENDPEDNSAPTTTKARNDLANFYYDFIVPDWSSTPANNLRGVSYKMHQRGTGGGFFGGACRWKVNVGRPVAAPRCSMAVTILGSAFAFVQPGGSISLTVTISNAGGTNAESFDGNGWPFTLDPDTIQGAQETITNYGTVSAFTQPNIPAVNRTVTRTYVVNRPTGVYEIAGYLRQGTTNNWIPCTNVAPTTTPPPNCVLSEPDCCPAATPAQAAYCVPVNVSTVPYLRSYGGDVIAGSGLRAGGSCQVTPTGAINTYIDRNASNQLIGSGTQMAAFALGTVNGFRTDTQNVNSRPQSRVFANRAYAGNSYGASVTTTQPFGGDYGGSLCADDWVAPTAGVVALPSSTVNMASLASGVYTYSGNVTLSGANVTGRKTLFVNGNVTITADTTYSGAWAGVTNIPNVVIVANNIYIHPDVTSVDAYLVARNTLWTCYDPNNIAAGVTTAGVRTSCLGRHLTVNGALLAGKINFWRMGGTIRNSTAGETFADSATRAGETVRLSPEFLISQQAGPSQNGSTGGLDRTYDSITNLSPTF